MAKLYDDTLYPVVETSGLADKVPTLQNGANKQTTWQKVRDLFETYFAVASNVTTALANKVDKVTGKGLINSYSAANTDAADSTVTINAVSGLAVFTRTIGAGAVMPFTIQNNLFDSNQKISPELDFIYEEGGEPGIIGYTVSPGQAVIYVKNYSADTSASGSKIIKFQIS